MNCSMPLFPVLHYLLELDQTHVHWVGDAIHHLVLHRPLLLLPSVFPSIRIFSNESALHIRWTKYWSFSFSISPSSEYSGLISIRMDWLDLFAVQGTLKSLLQHHSLKASILWHSAFFRETLNPKQKLTCKETHRHTDWFLSVWPNTVPCPGYGIRTPSSLWDWALNLWDLIPNSR